MNVSNALCASSRVAAIQIWWRSVEKLLEVLGEVVRRDALEVEPGDEVFEVARPPQVRRQDLAGEAHPIAVLVDAAVVDSGLTDLDLANSGVDLALLVVAVPDDLAVPLLVAKVLALFDVGCDLGLDGLGEHPLRSVSEHLRERVLRRSWTRMNRTRSVRHVAYLPLRGLVAGLDNRQGTPRVYPLIHNFRSYPPGATIPTCIMGR